MTDICAFINCSFFIWITFCLIYVVYFAKLWDLLMPFHDMIIALILLPVGAFFSTPLHPCTIILKKIIAWTWSSYPCHDKGLETKVHYKIHELWTGYFMDHCEGGHIYYLVFQTIYRVFVMFYPKSICYMSHYFSITKYTILLFWSAMFSIYLGTCHYQ